MNFLNCEMAFKCPEDWDGMVVTSDLNVKHCSTCNKDVHFCRTLEDLKKAINAQHCVTYISGEVEGNSHEVEVLISNLDDLNKSQFNPPRITRTTGIPKSYKGINSLFESSDDKDQWKS